MFRSAWLLGLFALVGVMLVVFSHQATYEQIAENRRLVLIRSLESVVPPALYNNQLYADVIEVPGDERLGSLEPVKVYRARKDGVPAAAVLEVVAPDGYSGRINLLVGIGSDGRLTGVRVVSHAETPGLGDAIETRKSGWILGFTGRSLVDPPVERWKVKRDGGAFDQLTGATITPRAVVKAVRRSLEYYAEHGRELFADPWENQP